MAGIEQKIGGASSGGSLTEQVAGELRTSILDGAYVAGDRLPSAAVLTVKHNVSRTVVREAIAALKSEGLVDSRKGAGVYVRESSSFSIPASRQKSLPEVIEMLEFRTAIEVEAAGLAAVRGSPAQRAAIQDALHAFDAPGAEQAGSPALDLAFHKAIARATNNPHFTSFLDSLGVSAVPRSKLLADEGQAAELADYRALLVREHGAIYDAIAARDEGAAREAMRIHLADSLRRYQAQRRNSNVKVGI